MWQQGYSNDTSCIHRDESIIGLMKDSMLRPRTKAGTEEMSARIRGMRKMLQGFDDSPHVDLCVAARVFKEYFSFDWVEEEEIKESIFYKSPHGADCANTAWEAEEKE